MHNIQEEMEEEEFPEFSYLLSLPAEAVSNGKTDSQGVVTSSGRKKNVRKQSFLNPDADEASRCTLPPCIGTDRHVTVVENLKHKETSCVSVNSRSRACGQLQPNLQQSMRARSQRQMDQPSQRQRQSKQVQLQHQERQKGGQQDREATRQLGELQQHQQYKQHRLTPRGFTGLTFQEQRTSSFPSNPTAPPATVQLHEPLASDVAAQQQRRRREATAAASAISKNRLDAYKQRRRLLAAKEQAAQQEEIEKSRLEFLERLQKQEAELEEWQHRQEKEGIVMLRLQQELDQQQAARKVQLKLLQAARAAAAQKALAAERAARAAAAEESGRRRENVRRMEQARAAARAKIAEALHRGTRNPGSSSPPVASGGSRETTTPSAATMLSRASHANTIRNSSYAGKGEKPPLLSSSTARRVALRQQKYATSFLHRQMEEGLANRDFPETTASALEHTWSSYSADASGASFCASCPDVSSSEGRGTKSTERHSHSQIKLCAASSEVITSRSTTASTTPFTYMLINDSSLLAGHPYVKQTGESSCEAEGGGTWGERRLGAGTHVNFAINTSAVASDSAVTDIPDTAAEPSKDLSTAAPPPALPLEAVSARSRHGWWWDHLADRPVAATHQHEEEWKQARGGQSPMHTPEGMEGNTCTSRNNPSCSVMLAVASTASTTPRAAASSDAPPRAVDALCFSETSFITRDRTLPAPPKETKTAIQASRSGDPSCEATNTQSSLPEESPVVAAFTTDTSVLRQCTRSVPHFPTRPTASEGIGCRSRVYVPQVAQQEDTSLTILPNYKNNKTSVDLSAGWPERLFRATSPLLVLDASPDTPFVVTCEKRRTHPTWVAGCLATARSSSSSGFNHTRNSTGYDVGVLDHDGGKRVCSMGNNSNICRDFVRTWVPRGEQNDSLAHILEHGVASNAQGGVARVRLDVSNVDDGVIDCTTEDTEHFLEKAENNTYMCVTAKNLRDTGETFADENSCAIRVLNAKSLLARRDQRETGRSDGNPGERYCVEFADDKSSLCQSPSISLSDGEAGMLETAGARRASPLTPKHATRWCSNSPTVSPQAYRSYGTPNFGRRLATSLVTFPDKNAASSSGSPREWRKKEITADNEQAVGGIGCILPTDVYSAQQPPPQEQGQLIEETPPQEEEKKEFDALQQGCQRRPTEEEQLSVGYATLPCTEAGRLTSYTPLLCGRGEATAGAESSRPARSPLVDMSVDGSSQAHRAADCSREVFDHQHSDEIPSDLTQRVRVEQQCRHQQPGEKFSLSLLELQAFSNQLCSLCSSSSSSDLNNSNGNCCCKARHADVVAPPGQPHSRQRSTANVAREKPYAAMDSEKELSAINDNASSATMASSVRFPAGQKRKVNWLRHFDSGRLEGQHRLQASALVADTAGEQTSDGADADAESNCTSADEAEDYPSTSAENVNEAEVEHQQSPHIDTTSKTDESCRNAASRDNGKSALIRKTQSGSLLFLKSVETAQDKLLPDQPNVTVPTWADSTGNVASQVKASCTTLAASAKARPPQRTAEMQQRKEVVGLECNSTFSEQWQQKQEGTYGDSKEGAGQEEHVLPLQNQSLSRKERRGREQHSQQQEGQLHANASEGEFRCKRGLQQLSGTGNRKTDSPTSLDGTACREPFSHREVTVTALLDEFLEIAS